MHCGTVPWTSSTTRLKVLHHTEAVSDQSSSCIQERVMEEDPKRKWWHIDFTMMVIVYVVLQLFVFPYWKFGGG
jgi:hypothetical protein